MNARQRQDAIVRSLRRNGTSTIDYLAQQVGVSRRTVLRDINALRNEGFVIHSEPGRGGGLQLDPRSAQTTVKLSVAEVFALLISVESIRAAANIPFSGLAKAGLAKIERALPQEQVSDLRRFLDCVFIGKLSDQVSISDMGEVDPDLLPAFEQAFLQQNRLRFRYQDAKGAVTQREVEPQAMLILPPLWYLVAWDPSRQDFRHFRMDRISSPQVIEGAQFLKRRVAFEQHVSPLRNFAK